MQSRLSGKEEFGRGSEPTVPAQGHQFSGSLLQGKMQKLAADEGLLEPLDVPALSQLP